MKRTLIGLLCAALALTMLAATAVAEASTDDFQQALSEAIEQYGDFYTWSFEKKADFYNTHVYHGVGTRRGVPCDHVLQKDAVIDIAKAYMLNTVGVTDAEVSNYVVDVDYWIECQSENDTEHELYAVAFLTQIAPHTFRNEYQISISPYSGEIIQFYDRDAETQ